MIESLIRIGVIFMFILFAGCIAAMGIITISYCITLLINKLEEKWDSKNNDRK